MFRVLDWATFYRLRRAARGGSLWKFGGLRKQEGGDSRTDDADDRPSVDTMLLLSVAALLGLVPSARPRCGALTLCAISSLPIEPLLPEIAQALNESPNLVLQAPPGAGKTTAVPLALLDSMSSSSSGTIIVLEPRRVAARGAATRMAALRGEPVGASIGYSVRGESRKSRDTRVLAVTEGVLVRRLQNDPMLEGVDCIIFDEVCACVCL